MSPAPTPLEAFLTEWGRLPLVAILRNFETETLVDVVAALADGGVRLVEVTLGPEAALEQISRLAGTLGDRVFLGAGTVLDSCDRLQALEAGARFLVSPGIDTDVLDRCRALGTPILCGALTPTEVLSAHRKGATAIKVFPSSAVGPGYFRELRGPFPLIPLVAVGGVNAENARAYLEAGASGLGLGTALADREAASQKRFTEIRVRAEALVRIVQEYAR